jgi:hypothetical protein
MRLRGPGVALALVAAVAHGTTMPGLVATLATGIRGTAAATPAVLHLPVAGHGVVAVAGRVRTPVAAAITGAVVPAGEVRRAVAMAAVVPEAAVTAVVEAIQAAAAEAATSSVGAAVPKSLVAIFSTATDECCCDGACGNLGRWGTVKVVVPRASVCAAPFHGWF